MIFNRRDRRSATDGGVRFCESCGQVCTAADRARARLDQVRTQVAMLGLPR